MEPKPLTFYTDRSAAELDDKCGMAFFHNRLAGGKGLVPREEHEALMVGRTVHEDLALIAEMEDISEAAIAAGIQRILTGVTPELLREHVKKTEILYRRLGWIASFALFVEPTIREHYENVAVEKEIALDRDPLVVGITPDRLLRHRKGGYLVYREYKSTISAGQKWVDSWKYAIQIHTSLKAVEEEMGEPVKFAQVMGLMKGTPAAADGRLIHPYVWAYFNTSTGKWTPEYMRGEQWVSRPVWEFPGGVVEWVKLCGEEVALKQFPHTEPIFLNEGMVEEWVRRRLQREREIAAIKTACLTDEARRGVVFEKRTNRCRPPFGDSCSYLPLCWNASWAARPQDHPDFVERTPHHDLELIV